LNFHLKNSNSRDERKGKRENGYGIMAAFLLCFFSLLSFSFSLDAADIYLGLTAHGNRMELGMAGFIPANGTVDEAKFARLIQDVLRNDLLFSRYFNLVEDGPMFTGKDAEIVDWQDKGANVLVCGKLAQHNRDIELTGQLYDVYGKSVIWEKVFKGTLDDLRSLAHDMNDEVIFRFTGEKGIAHTKIAFTNNGTGYKELYLVDYDGFNPRRITNDRSINILPKWSPDGREMIYTTYKYGNPDLYSISPEGTSRRPVSTLQGLNTAGSFSPDGKQIALTLSRGEYPNIFIIERDGKQDYQLTFGRAIATSPYFAPNGKEIVFVCDKPGYPQLYIMNLDGGNMRRLTTPGFCDSPCWSPRGDKIAFSQRVDDQYGYEIFMYDLNTLKTIRLTFNPGNDENPSFSPDGRFVVFTSTKFGKKELNVMAIDGSGLRKIAEMPGSSTTPAWSQ
jgi:TolB protein